MVHPAVQLVQLDIQVVEEQPALVQPGWREQLVLPAPQEWVHKGLQALKVALAVLVLQEQPGLQGKQERPECLAQWVQLVIKVIKVFRVALAVQLAQLDQVRPDPLGQEVQQVILAHLAQLVIQAVQLVILGLLVQLVILGHTDQKALLDLLVPPALLVLLVLVYK